jgi:hypothetical protein
MSDEDYTEREYVVCVQQDVYSGSLSKRGTRARTYTVHSVYSRQCGFVLVLFLCQSTWLKQGELLLFQQQLAQTWELLRCKKKCEAQTLSPSRAQVKKTLSRRRTQREERNRERNGNSEDALEMEQCICLIEQADNKP